MRLESPIFSNNKLVLCVVAALSVCMIQCGDDDEDPPPTIVYSTLTTENADREQDNKTVELTALSTCQRNGEDGHFTFSASNGTNLLEFKVKGFNSTPQSYTCTQAADNIGDETGSSDLGGRYDDCRVAIQLAQESGYNAYKMHRDSASMYSLEYTGTCTITFTEIGSTTSGSVDCNELIQTINLGNSLNPYSGNVDVAAEFSCPTTNI